MRTVTKSTGNEDLNPLQGFYGFVGHVTDIREVGKAVKPKANNGERTMHNREGKYRDGADLEALVWLYRLQFQMRDSTAGRRRNKAVGEPGADI